MTLTMKGRSAMVMPAPMATAVAAAAAGGGGGGAGGGIRIRILARDPRGGQVTAEGASGLERPAALWVVAVMDAS